MANQKLGDTLRDLRNAKGLTQQQAADLLGLKNKSTLGSWEISKSEPDAYTFLRLCKLYGVEDIYGAFGEVPPKRLPDEEEDFISKFDQLHEEYKKLVLFHLDQLLHIQNDET